MSEIEDLKDEIKRLQKSNDLYYRMATYVIGLVMQIKTNSISVDNALSDIKKFTSDFLWETLYHIYLKKDSLGVTSSFNLNYIEDENLTPDDMQNMNIKE